MLTPAMSATGSPHSSDETAAVRRSLEETVSARSYGELAGFEGAR